MADAAAIIIKKVKKGHAAHHGGAWKVAYADFVTAMMAFFLLMWLLNAASEESLSGIADYFTPTAILSSSESGAGGMLGGTSMLAPGAQSTTRTAPGVTVSLSPLSPSDIPDDEGLPGIKRGNTEERDMRDELADLALTEDEFGDGSGAQGLGGDNPNDGKAGLNDGYEGKDGENPFESEYTAGLTEEYEGQGVEQAFDESALDDEASQELLAKLEQQDFERAEQALREAIAASPELQAFSENLIIDMTPLGMRIQIADAEESSMFPSGSAKLLPHTKKLLGKILQAILPLPNSIAILGHTDAVPYHGTGGYSNWELSTDRANASRRALTEAGLPASRIVRDTGMAATEPLLPEDPTNPQNRRISVLILREGIAPVMKAP
jgi:chemotaxis protein MotB